MPVERCADCGEIIPLDGSFKATLRKPGVEMSGLIGDFETLTALAEAVRPLGVLVIASPAEPHGGCRE